MIGCKAPLCLHIAPDDDRYMDEVGDVYCSQLCLERWGRFPSMTEDICSDCSRVRDEGELNMFDGLCSVCFQCRCDEANNPLVNIYEEEEEVVVDTSVPLTTSDYVFIIGFIVLFALSALGYLE